MRHTMSHMHPHIPRLVIFLGVVLSLMLSGSTHVFGAVLLTSDGQPVTTYTGPIQDFPYVYTTGNLLIRAKPTATITILLLKRNGETSFPMSDLSTCYSTDTTCDLPLRVTEPVDLIIEEDATRDVYRIIPDHTPPTLRTFSARSDGSVHIEAEDDTLLSTVNVTRETEDETIRIEDSFTDDGQADLSFPPLDDGVQATYTIILTDVAGNTKKIVKRIVTDAYPPIITLPEGPGPYRQGGIRFTVEDDRPFSQESIHAMIDDTPVSFTCVPSTRGFTCRIPAQQVPQSTFTLRVEASDAAGNPTSKEVLLKNREDSLPPIPLDMWSEETFQGDDALGKTLTVLFDEQYGLLPTSVHVTLTPRKGISQSLTAETCTRVDEGVACTFTIPDSFLRQERSTVTATVTSATDLAGNVMDAADTLSVDFFLPGKLLLSDLALAADQTSSISLLTSEKSIPVISDGAYALTFTLSAFNVPPEVNLSLKTGDEDLEQSFSSQDVRDSCTLQAGRAICTVGTIPGRHGLLSITMRIAGDRFSRRVTLIPRRLRSAEGERISLEVIDVTPSTYLPDVQSMLHATLTTSLGSGKLLGITGLSCRGDPDATLSASFESGYQPGILLTLSPPTGMREITVTCSGRPLILQNHRIRELDETTFTFTLKPFSGTLPSPEEKAKQIADQGSTFLTSPSIKSFVDISKNLISACKAKSIVSLVSEVIDSADVFVRGVSGGTINLKVVSDKLDDVDKIFNTGVIADACSILTCQSPFQTNLADQLNSKGILSNVLGTDIEGTLSDMLGYPGSNLPDAWNTYLNKVGGDQFGMALSTVFEANEPSVQETLTTSLLGLCPEGIVKNLNLLIQSDCKYVSCLQRVASGEIGSVELCDRVHAYEQCVFISREVESLIPGGIRGILAGLGDAFQHPAQSVLKLALGDVLGDIGYENLHGPDAILRVIPKGMEFATHLNEFSILIDISTSLGKGDYRGAWNTVVEKEFGKDYCGLVQEKNGGDSS